MGIEMGAGVGMGVAGVAAMTSGRGPAREGARRRVVYLPPKRVSLLGSGLGEVGSRRRSSAASREKAGRRWAGTLRTNFSTTWLWNSDTQQVRSSIICDCSAMAVNWEEAGKEMATRMVSASSRSPLAASYSARDTTGTCGTPALPSPRWAPSEPSPCWRLALPLETNSSHQRSRISRPPQSLASARGRQLSCTGKWQRAHRCCRDDDRKAVIVSKHCAQLVRLVNLHTSNWCLESCGSPVPINAPLINELPPPPFTRPRAA